MTEDLCVVRDLDVRDSSGTRLLARGDSPDYLDGLYDEMVSLDPEPGVFGLPADPVVQ